MWSYIVAASQGDPPVGSSRVFGALPHPFRGPSRPPAVLFRQPAARPRPLGEPSRPPGEPSRRAGEPSRHLGESSRPSGESSRPLGEPSRPHGESSRSLGEPSRPHGESSRSLGEPSRPHGESSRPTARSSRPVVRISRPTVRSVRPRQDSPMPRSQPVFRYNGPYPRTLRHGLRSRQENHNSETRRSHSLPCIQARLTRPPIDIRKVTGLYPTLEQVRRKLEPGTSRWRRFRNRVCGALGLPIKRGPTKPTDWFLDKFAVEEFYDNDEPEEQCGPSWLCCCKRSVDPTHSVHYHWLAVVSLAVLYNMVFVIGRAVFWELDKASTSWFALDYLCDAIYLIDTAIHMHEGYLEQGIMVKDARMLRQNYMKSDWWPYDFISLIPTDIAYYWWPPGKCDFDRLPCPVIVRLNRLFRLPRMWEWFDRTETATSFPNAFRICKVVMAILVLIHWNACLFFAISYMIGFGTDNWVYNITGSRNETLAHQYIYSFYWSTLTLTTIGETPQPEIDVEYIFVVLDFLAGVLIFATIVGNIGSMISNMNVARVEFQNKMDGVKQYMAFRKVSGELEARVIRWFAYTWAESGALDEEHVLASLPDKLKAEIAIRVHLDTLREVEIFKDCEPGLLEALVLKLKLQVFSPGDYICRKGDVGKEMYIVKRGRLQVVADDGTTVLATLGAGSVFGEVSVLDIAGNRTGNRRTANVRALGYSDLFCLAKRDLWEALADYPEARATLTKRGCQLLRKDGLLDETVFESAKTTQLSLEENVRKLESTVDLLHNRLQGLLADVGQEQAKLKQRISKIECRFDSDEEFDSDDTSPELLHNERKATSSMESPSCSTQYGSTIDASHPVRERGYSLCVDRSPDLLEITPEPRSKSLRLKRKEIPN